MGRRSLLDRSPPPGLIAAATAHTRQLLNDTEAPMNHSTTITDDEATALARFYTAETGVTDDVLNAVRALLVRAGINPETRGR